MEAQAQMRAPATQQRVGVTRRSNLHFGPGPAPSRLVEAPSDRFDLSVKPDAVDDRLQRLEFNWRSPSQNLLMSPKVILEFDVVVRSSRDITQISQNSAVCYNGRQFYIIAFFNIEGATVMWCTNSIRLYGKGSGKFV